MFFTIYDIRNTIYECGAGRGILLPSRYRSSSEARPPSLSFATLIFPAPQALRSASNPPCFWRMFVFFRYAIYYILYTNLVPKGGFEPPWSCLHMVLNHARLPIPPLRHYLTCLLATKPFQIDSSHARMLPENMGLSI